MRIAGLALVMLSGCVAASTQRPWPEYDQLVVPQLRTTSGESMYDLLARTRPMYLRPRSPRITELQQGQDLIGVVINGHYSGGIEALQTVSADYVYSVRRLSASEATIRYGRHFVDGALEVTLRR